MGCASSKATEVAVAADIYRRTPSSFALFDIASIQEPWIDTLHHHQQGHQKEKTLSLPPPILQKLDTFELASSDAPHSWSEVSKALEELKPTLHQKADDIDDETESPKFKIKTLHAVDKPPKKSSSFHTLEELDAKLSSKPSNNSKKEERARVAVGPPPPPLPLPPPDSSGFKSVRENIFVLRDRLGIKDEGGEKDLKLRRRDPLSGYPEKCPPGGSNSVVLYTTTLRGVRRTFEDCQRARQLIEAHLVAVDERDVALHGEFLKEVRELVGEESSVPRLFVKGRYIGGVEEVVELNESGRLRELLRTVGRTGEGRKGCEGCGGVRFVPCLDCNGSCKVVVSEGEKKGTTVRCSKCNENGLVQCPICH